MAIESSIFTNFKSKGIISGGELVIYKEFCSAFLEASKSANLAVIGIEGFYLFNDGKIMPNMDEIADFSAIQNDTFNSYIDICFSAASGFIDNMLINGKSNGYSFILVHADEL